MSHTADAPTARTRPRGRVEDAALLSGRASFVDDTDARFAAAFVRSPHARARITGIDDSDALDVPGLIGLYTWEDLPEPVRRRLPVALPHKSLAHPRTPYALARDTVNYLGEPIAMVVATDRYTAEDVASRVRVDFEVLPPVVGIAQSEAADTLVHNDVPGNIAGVIEQSSGNAEQALAAASRVITFDLAVERSMASPLEGRGVLARPRDEGGGVLVSTSTQVPHAVRAAVAHMLGLQRADVDVVVPAVGGAFGVKGVRPWPEEVLVPWAAMALGCSVKWTEDRREHFVASAQERQQLQRITVGFEPDGTVAGYTIDVLHDIGAYSQYGLVVSQNTSSHLVGPYDIAHKKISVTALYTNAVMVAPYRGAGRPEAAFAVERMMDAVAADLKMDRVAVRQRNLLRPDALPYHQGVIGQDGQEVVFDSGDYPGALRMAVEAIDWAGFPDRQRAAAAEGKRLGIGIGCYVENSGLGPFEGADVEVSPTGVVTVTVGTSSQGQGHETVFATIAAEALHVPVESVRVVTGDTRRFPMSVGTYASRTAVTVGTAVHRAAGVVADRVRELAGRILEVDAGDVELVDGSVGVRGIGSSRIPLSAMAVLASPLVYGFEQASGPALDVLREHPGAAAAARAGAPTLQAREWFHPAGATYPYGVHAAVVETDPDTAEIRILDYCVVHDCGTVLNATIVDGQVHGGVAQGVGGALYERMHYDDTGQLLNASFMDFLMPYSTEVPRVRTLHLDTPSPHNELGVKGAGEAGVIPVSAVIAAAVEDAEKIPIRTMPVSPSDLFHLRQAIPHR